MGLLLGVLAWAFGNQAEVSVVLGLVLALSSTTVVMQLLSQQRAMAKESELYVQALITGLVDSVEGRPDGAAPLLAAHCMAMFQDWYVKRWKYRAAKVTPDQFAESTVRFVRSHLAAPRTA